MHVTIGTRGSRLALWQADYVRERLEAGGLTAELITIETKGDQILDRSLAKIGSKGIFTEELEDALRSGRIDIAVHSAKDLPSRLPARLDLIAFTEREAAHDVLISRQTDVSLRSGRPFTVGTSSTRRVAMLRHFAPHVTPVNIRGNLQTRLRKLDEGHADALLLAYAGVHRMGFEDLIVEHLPLDPFTPAVGQGSVAIEAADTLDVAKRERIRQLLNHTPTETCLLAERAFLRTLEGGCSIPVFALATLANDQTLRLAGGLISLDGQTLLREEHALPAPDAPALGNVVAERLLARGGQQILDDIRQAL